MRDAPGPIFGARIDDALRLFRIILPGKQGRSLPEGGEGAPVSVHLIKTGVVAHREFEPACPPSPLAAILDHHAQAMRNPG